MRKYLLRLGAVLLIAGPLTVSAPAARATVQTSPAATPASSAVQLPWIHDQASHRSPANAPLLMDKPPSCACFTLCVMGDHCCPVVVNGQCTNECIPNDQHCPK